MFKINCLAKVYSVVMLVFMVLFATIASAAFYKWVDDNGAVYFSDKAPHQGEGDATMLDPDRMGAGVSTVKGDPAMQTRVELYSTSWCTYCKQARAFFKKNNIRFRDYDIERNTAAALRKKRLDPKPGVPFVVINGVKIHGYQESAYAKALKLK